MNRTYRIFLLLGFLLLGASQAQAQITTPADVTMAESPYIKEFGRPGIPKITVYLWGDAANNGIWRIEENTDLLTFLTAASVSGFTSRRPETEVDIFLHVYRPGQGGRNEAFFESEAEELLQEGRASLPTLRNGDVVVVETRTRRRFTWRDISQITGTVASLIGLYFTIDRLGR